MVRGIGEDLLVSLHGGVEDDLSPRLSRGAQGFTPEHAAVAQDEDGGYHPETTFPLTIVFHGPPRSVQPAKGVLRLLL